MDTAIEFALERLLDALATADENEEAAIRDDIAIYRILRSMAQGSSL